MARLRNDNAAALIPDRTRELAEIADWYRRALADEPARRWNTGPTLIGPTWKRGADGGWLLPEHTLGWDFLAWCGYWLRDSKARTPWKWTLEQARFWPEGMPPALLHESWNVGRPQRERILFRHS